MSRFPDGTYEGVRRIVYGEEEYAGATFVPVCTTCGRFVKADETVRVGEAGLASEPNATCRRCGRVEMLFEGFV